MTVDHKEESFPMAAGYTLLSASGMSLVGLLGKLGDSIFLLPSLIFWRFLSGFLICFTMLWFMGLIRHQFWVKNLKMHLLRALLVLGAQYSFYYYIQKESLLNGTMLLSTGPLFIPIIEWIVLKKKVRAASWLAIGISFVGVICVLQPDREIISLFSAIGLFSGICQGASQVVFGINVKEERSDVGVLYLMFFCALLSLGPFLIGETIEPGDRGGFWPSILLVLGLGLASVFNQLARATAYQHGEPSRLAVFLYFSVILAGFWDWLVFNQLPNWLSVLGAVLIICAGILKLYFTTWFPAKK